MRDINFFSSALKKRKTSNMKNILIFGIIFVILLSVAGAYVSTEFVVSDLNKNITTMKDYLSSTEVVEKQKKLTKLQNQLDILNNYGSSIDAISDAINKSMNINSNLIDILNKAIPTKTNIINVTYNQTNITLAGTASNRIEAAEFLHNLKETGLFKYVYLNALQNIDAAGNIASPESTVIAPDIAVIEEVSFTVLCALKDVI